MEINKIFEKAKNIIKDYQEQNKQIEEQINNSMVFNNFNTITNNNIINDGRIEEILILCPNLNIDNAKIIDSLIPINETYVKVLYITEKKTKLNYYIVLTDKRIWILDKEKYLYREYTSTTIFNIITKSLMSQLVNYNNNILLIDTTQNNIIEVNNILLDINYRNNYIQEKTKYLCNIIPIYQRLNKINSGISIDNNKNIVFHNKKINNYLCNYNDILNYELLEDQTVIQKKKSNEYSHNITSVKQSCTSISIRVTLTNNTVFQIIILEPTTFNSEYNHTTTTYLNNYNFAKEIMDKLDSLNDKLY